MDIDSALEKIYSLKQFHVKLGLDNIKSLLNHIGNPQNKLTAVHVAGSNGKGSTCSFLASILQEFDYKVGLYTSPHFIRFNERVRINGEEIPDSEIIGFLEGNKNYINKYKPTFFEITTALAFEYFAKENVDIAIIETGLGGRLDATNVLIPAASVITSISLEHTHILGDSLEKVAIEKGGIIKKNVPVFIAHLEEEAEKAIEKISSENNSEINYLADHWNRDDKNLKLKNGSVKIVHAGLPGIHQLDNAALAVFTLNSVLGLNKIELIRKGLDNVIRNTGIQGRYEKFGPKRNILFDSAHNLDSTVMFLEEFKKEQKHYFHRTLIFGAMRDKDIKQMLLLLNPYFDKILMTSINFERAASAGELVDIAESEGINAVKIENPDEIVQNYILKNDNSLLVVLGSIYLLGEIKKKLTGQN